jgi:Flp pilus assembly protein TadB
MVAMPLFDLIVVATWVGGLTVILLGQAFLGWMKLRYARRAARHASRLFEATRAIPQPHSIPSAPAELLEQGDRSSVPGPRN